MKSKLEKNDGFALTAVIALLFVLSLMGTAMYGYTMTSLRSVRFLSDQKKAEYLAQAGAEASAYAYQLAVNNRGTDADVNEFIIETSGENDTIKTNKIFLIWNRDESPAAYRYVTENALGSYSDKEIIGYYQVDITNLTQTKKGKFLKTETNSDGSGVVAEEEVEMTDKQRRFTSHGYAVKDNDIDEVVPYTITARLSEPIQGLGTFYDNDGTNAGIIDPVSNTNFTSLGTVTFPSTLKLNTKHFGSLEVTVGNRSIPAKLAYSSGNLILNAPETGVIKFKENQDNIASFVGINDLFVNTNIDVTPTQKNYNIMFLKGNNIVLNGDVEIYVYGFYRNTNSMFSKNTGTIKDVIQGKYRFSTVVLGTANPDTSTVSDPIKNSTYNLGRCGKVFFGGDVYVNIEMPSVGVYRYKAFSSGDVYYFDDDAPQNSGSETEYGVDLLKYFLDYSIATNKYSQNVLNRFEDLIQIYYENTTDKEPTQYVVGDGSGNITKNLMRKIDVDNNTKDTYSSIIPPDPTDSSSLTWE